MTTIAYKDGILAADTLVVTGATRAGYATKIHRVGQCLVGLSGKLAFLHPFMTWLEHRIGASPLIGLSDDDQSTGLVVHPDERLELFTRTGSWFLRPILGATVLGSGCEYAEGAMAQGATAEQAVRIAMIYDTATGGEVDVLILDEHQGADEASLGEDEDDDIDALRPIELNLPPAIDEQLQDWRARRGLS